MCFEVVPFLCIHPEGDSQSSPHSLTDSRPGSEWGPAGGGLKQGVHTVKAFGEHNEQYTNSVCLGG